MYPNNYVPPMLSPVYTYTGDTAPAQGKVVAGSVAAAAAPPASHPASSPVSKVLASVPDTPKVPPANNSNSPSPVPVPATHGGAPVPPPVSGGELPPNPKNVSSPATPPVDPSPALPSGSKLPTPKVQPGSGDNRGHHCPVKKNPHNKKRLRRSHESGDFSLAF